MEDRGAPSPEKSEVPKGKAEGWNGRISKGPCGIVEGNQLWMLSVRQEKL
jgi:hypothetical protein